MRSMREARPTPGGTGQSVRDTSELNAQAGGRGDVLLRLEAVGKAAIDVRNHYTRVEIDALDRPPVDKGGERVLRARAPVAVDARNGELAAIRVDEGGVGADASCRIEI